MARKTKTFGPLLYGTLLVGLVVVLAVGTLHLLEWRAATAEAAKLDVVAAAVGPILPAFAAADPTDRVRAIQAFAEVYGRLGLSDAYRPGIEAMHLALRDPEWEVRSAAAGVLGRFGSEARAATDGLIAALGDQEPEVRVAAAASLLRIGGDGREAAFCLLRDLAGGPGAATDRATIVEALALAGDAGQDAAAGAVAAWLADRDAAVRAEAIHCVPALGPAAARLVPLVSPLLDSKDPGVRHAAAAVAVQIGDPEADPDPRAPAVLEGVMCDAALSIGDRQEALCLLYHLEPPPGMGMGAAVGSGMPGSMMGVAPAGSPAGPSRHSALRRCGLKLARQLADEDADVRYDAAVLLRMIDPETLSGRNDPAPAAGP